MAIEHIVLVEKKENTTDEEMNAFMEAVGKLKDKVPGILEVKSGNNFSERSPHTHAAIVTMADKNALAGYGPHPDHQDVANQLREVAKDWVIVDIET